MKMKRFNPAAAAAAAAGSVMIEGVHVLDAIGCQQVHGGHAAARGFVGWNDWTKRNYTEYLALLTKFEDHNGCVNTISWSEDGQLLVSGSDDRKLIITAPFANGNERKWEEDDGPELRTNSPRNVHTRTVISSGHTANIFSAKFLPSTNNAYVVSCAADGSVILTDIDHPDTYGSLIYSCHSRPTYEVATINGDPFCFATCSEDATVRLFDRRIKTSCSTCRKDVILEVEKGIGAIDISTENPWLIGIGCSDGTARVYDRRQLRRENPDIWKDSIRALWRTAGIKPRASSGSRRITSVDFGSDGDSLLVSYSADCVYLYSLSETEPPKKIDDNGTSKKTVDSNGGRNDPSPTVSNDRNGDQNNDDEGIGGVRRVRLRGDWSDTGPESAVRPPNEAGGGDGTGEDSTNQEDNGDRSGNILQRFSNLLTNWLHTDSDEGEAETASAATTTTEADHGQQEEDEEQGTDKNNSNLNPVDVDHGDQGPSTSAENPYPTTTTTDSGNSTHQDSGYPGPSGSNHQDDGNEAPETASTTTFADVSIGGDGGTTHNIRVGFADATDDDEDDHDEERQHDDSISQSQETQETPPSTSSEQQEIGTESHHKTGGGEEEAAAAAVEDEQEARELEIKRRKMIVRVMEEEKRKRDVQKALAGAPRLKTIQRYKGHRNSRTMLKQSCFWGRSHVMSGSDCGHVFIWDRQTGRVSTVLEADKHVVNCLQPHPRFPFLATSGIDYDIKLWTPMPSVEPKQPRIPLAQLIERNEQMLAQTSETVTIPASFMFRMIANMNRVRQERRQQQRRAQMLAEEEVVAIHSAAAEGPPAAAESNNPDDSSS